MIEAQLRDFAPVIAQKLREELRYEPGAFDSVYRAMEYSLMAGGKRLRPFLVGAFYHAAGGKGDAYLGFAAALEMIHTYSLIHDDLPCMDNDDFRRGRPSCHKAFGEATALLAGDALLTHAFSAAAKTTGIDPALTLRGISMLSALAGADGMIGGQVIDLESENRSPALETVTEMYRKKTGALLAAGAKIGALLGGADEAMIEAAEEYAMSLGMAFQIVDDLLDQTGDSALLGKPVGSDEKNQKATYVSLVGTEQARCDAAAYTERAKAALAPFGGGAAALCELADYLIDRRF